MRKLTFGPEPRSQAAQGRDAEPAGASSPAGNLNLGSAQEDNTALFDDFIFMAAPRYYRGADTGRQAERDAFTALGVEMVTTSAPGAPPATAHTPPPPAARHHPRPP